MSTLLDQPKMSPVHLATTVLAILLSGCLHTVSGPGRAARPASAANIDNLRVVYAGQHQGEPATFVASLGAEISDALGRPIEIERAHEQQVPEVMSRWPAGVAGPREGEETILIRAAIRMRCGTPAQVGMVASVLTLGLLPFLDGNETTWVIEVYGPSGTQVRRSEFQVRRNLYGWLPLVPFVPANVAWRAIRGDERDYFLRTYPSHLVAALSDVEPRRPPDGREDARR